MIKKTWYVPCSPRSPEKIKPELEVFKKLEGQNWNELHASYYNLSSVERKKYRDQLLVNQVKFAEMLKKCPTFDGSISEKRPAFSARDRVAPMKTFGFAFTDTNGIIHITEAGNRLIKNRRPREIFLKQFLKWQYPSYQHGGRKGTRKLYPETTFAIFPFIEALYFTRELEGITKREVAIFLIPHRNPKGREKIIEEINDFRERLDRFDGRKSKNEFRDSYHLESIEEIYKEEIENRRITIRERRQRGTIESFIQTKKRNSLDYADALIRHCRYSGLFSIKKKRLTLLPEMINEIEEILLLKHEFIDFYDDVERFYSYMGNPDIPILPYETEEKLITKIQRLQFENVQLIEEVQKVYEFKIREKIPSYPRIYTLNNLKDCLDSLYQLKTNLRKIKLELESQRPQFLDEIIECYERIVNREILSRDIYYEWNTWRAFVFLDDAIKIIPNFSLDINLEPIHNALGNQSDFEVHFDGFVILGEVTLSRGSRQYDTESEPVTRHIGRFQKGEIESDNPRKVFGVFIPEKLHKNTVHYFFVHMKSMANPDFGGFVTIIPFELQIFINILNFVRSIGRVSRREIKLLFERLENLKETSNNGEEWISRFPEEIENWKSHIRKSRI